jgi:hypothetical protein
MATGYTHDVADGKVTEFPAFALSCARAFGACITMRDDDPAKPIPDEFKPDTWCAKWADEAKGELERLEEMTFAARQAAYRADVAATEAVWEKSEAERKAKRERYESMLAKVEAWTPPSDEHVELKKFMVSQLADSIKFDCSNSWERPVAPTVAQWYAEKVKSARKRIADSEDEQRKENERAAGRNRWIRQLRESLALVPA